MYDICKHKKAAHSCTRKGNFEAGWELPIRRRRTLHSSLRNATHATFLGLMLRACRAILGSGELYDPPCKVAVHDVYEHFGRCFSHVRKEGEKAEDPEGNQAHEERRVFAGRRQRCAGGSVWHSCEKSEGDNCREDRLEGVKCGLFVAWCRGEGCSSRSDEKQKRQVLGMDVKA